MKPKNERNYLKMQQMLKDGQCCLMHFDRLCEMVIDIGVFDQYKYYVEVTDTLCAILRGEYIVIGYALQSPFDTYKRKIGNLVAFGRALSNSKNGTIVLRDANEIGNSYASAVAGLRHYESVLVGRGKHEAEAAYEHYAKLIGNLKPYNGDAV